MKRLAPFILATAISGPVAAQDSGTTLMERGMQLFIEGLLQEMEPALDDLQGLAEDFGPALNNFASEMGPALRELLQKVEDWSAYEPPEILPNGDIIIRRKKDRPIEPEPENEQIEL